MNKYRLKFLISLLSIFFVLLFSISSASAFSLFPNEPSATSGNMDYREYIVNFYVFALPASALVAVVLIMIGGIIWITSAGDQGRIAKAKEFIINSIIGLVILAGTYVILGFINPALVILQPVGFDDLGKFGACTFTKDNLLQCTIAEQKNCEEILKGSFKVGETCGNSLELRAQQRCETIIVPTNSPNECNLTCAQRGGSTCRGKSIEGNSCPCHVGPPVEGTPEQQARDERLTEIVQSKSEEQEKEELCQKQSAILTPENTPSLPELVWADDCSAWCGNAPSFEGRSCRNDVEDSKCVDTSPGRCARVDCRCTLR